MKSLKATAWVLAFGIGLILEASCSSSRPVMNGNSSTTTESSPPKAAEGPLFEVLNAWTPKKVTVETYAVAGEPAPRFTLSPKPGIAFVAIELMLKRDDPRQPVPAAMWNTATRSILLAAGSES